MNILIQETKLIQIFAFPFPGHAAKKCPSKKYYSADGETLSCFICWRKGHVRRECPLNKYGEIKKARYSAKRAARLFEELPMPPDEAEDEPLAGGLDEDDE